MSRPPRKFHGASYTHVDPSTLRLNWSAIDHDGGIEFAQTAKEEIRKVTLAFLDRVQAEQSAPRAIGSTNSEKKKHLARDGVIKIREAATTIVHWMRINQSDEVTSEANTLVAANFNELLETETFRGLPAVKWTWKTRLEPLLAYVEAIVVACDKAEIELDGLEAIASEYWKDGAAWAAWVCDLAAIFRKAGGRSTTRGPKAKVLTGFVSLVGQLETSIPEEFAPPRSKVALSKAVQRALRAGGQLSTGAGAKTVV